MTEMLQVTATTLNLRRSPVINPANIIGTLGQGEVVQKTGQPTTDWFEVRCSRSSGFAAARFLSPVQAPTPPQQPATGTPAFVPRPVHFAPSASAQLGSIEQRHCPLGGFDVRSRQAGQSDATRCATLGSIVDLLDVEHSARYQPTVTTFCNIYAYDFCYLAGVYLPRVWWMAKALLDLRAGADPGVAYGKTVRELTANALYDWLSEWGDDYGWQRCADVDELQGAANRGSVGVVCAQRRDLSRSGHIVVVVPEIAGHAADRVGQGVVRPLQSQAGARNKRYFCNQWWVDLAAQFRATGFWAHA
ncbi:MAG TPA: SH3 domain-containing protein [Steroidobacteraceae bacterium]|nr:SH3 domain-containing protein [Steroidobacteraceae bacterium]